MKVVRETHFPVLQKVWPLPQYGQAGQVSVRPDASRFEHVGSRVRTAAKEASKHQGDRCSHGLQAPALPDAGNQPALRLLHVIDVSGEPFFEGLLFVFEFF